MRAATEYHIQEEEIPPLSVMIVKGQEDLSIKVRKNVLVMKIDCRILSQSFKILSRLEGLGICYNLGILSFFKKFFFYSYKCLYCLVRTQCKWVKGVSIWWCKDYKILLPKEWKRRYPDKTFISCLQYIAQFSKVQFGSTYSLTLIKRHNSSLISLEFISSRKWQDKHLIIIWCQFKLFLLFSVGSY